MVLLQGLEILDNMNKNIHSRIKAYIKNELGIKELEDFLLNLNSSKTLYDELEIYYIIEEGLNKEIESIFDVKKELELKRKKANKKLKILYLLYILKYVINTLLFISSLSLFVLSYFRF